MIVFSLHGHWKTNIADVLLNVYNTQTNTYTYKVYDEVVSIHSSESLKNKHQNKIENENEFWPIFELKFNSSDRNLTTNFFKFGKTKNLSRPSKCNCEKKNV